MEDLQMEHAAGRTAASTAADHYALEALRWDWGDAYEIGHDDERGWRARRRDGLGGDLTATDPDGLYALIGDDYALRPVPRDYSAPLDDS
jgi:hypothetical protein